jgi:protein ImuB
VACANETARLAGIAKALGSRREGARRRLARPARDEGVERETLERLAAWAGQFTPMASLDRQGIVLEIGASLKLFDGHASRARLQGVREIGLHATIGIAPTPCGALFARAEAHGLRVRGCVARRSSQRLADCRFLLDWPDKTLAHRRPGVLRCGTC